MLPRGALLAIAAVVLQSVGRVSPCAAGGLAQARRISVIGRVSPTMYEGNALGRKWYLPWGGNWYVWRSDGVLLNQGAPPGRYRSMVGTGGRYELRSGINGDPHVSPVHDCTIVVTIYGGQEYHDETVKLTVRRNSRMRAYIMPSIKMRRK